MEKLILVTPIFSKSTVLLILFYLLQSACKKENIPPEIVIPEPVVTDSTTYTCDSCGSYTDRAICINDICKSYRVKYLLLPLLIDVDVTPLKMVITTPYVEPENIFEADIYIIHDPYQLGSNSDQYHKVIINDTVRIKMNGPGTYGVYWFFDSDIALLNPLNDEMGHGASVFIK